MIMSMERRKEGNAMERTVYILLTRSGTCFSRLIHLATADRYTHVSIGLDGPLGSFYSFGRKYQHLMLPAGLVEERVRWGLFGSQPATPCCLYQLKVSQQVYNRLERRLEEMYGERELYHYNILGALACYLQLPLPRRYHYFCSQFVASLLQESGALELPKDPGLTRPADFCRLEQLRPIHQGAIGGIPAAA